MNRPGTAGRAAVLAALVVMVTPLTVAAAILWTLTASPLTATAGVTTRFTLTATNEDLLLNEIGCVVVDVPSNFAVHATAVTATNADGPWTSSHTGNRVKVWASGGGARLELLEWVRFTIDATPLAPGELAWNGNAYGDHDCGGSGSLLGVPPVVLVTGSTVTPSPTPTPTPTPTPLVPLPTVSLTPLPTLDILSTPTPTANPTAPPPGSARPAPTATPGQAGTTSGGAGASPAVTPSPTATPASAATPTPSAAGGTEGPLQPGSGTPFALVGHGDGLDLGIDVLGSLDGIEVWFVPAAVVGAPGLLVVVWVALQALGGAVWLPAVRRMLGDDDRATRRRL